MRSRFWIGIILVIGTSLAAVSEEELDIDFVGTVESSGDVLLVRVDDILVTAEEDICDVVEVRGNIEGISLRDRVHVKGSYDPGNCVVEAKAEDHFIYKIPEGAALERLNQSIQFTGKIARIYKKGRETFCDIFVDEVLMVTFQEKEMCTMVTVKMNPAVGDVEEGLELEDEVEFSGTYDEKTCMGSLGWHDDYLKKKRRAGVSWILIIGGFVGYLVLRRV